LIVLLAVFPIGCSGGGDDGQNGDAGADGLTGDGTVLIVGDHLGEGSRDDVGFESFGEAASFEFVPEEGGFLWPCNEASDCMSGYCITTAQWGQVCTDYCEEECPLNWKCQSKQIGADTIFLCVAPEEHLCNACLEDDDCGGPDDYCVVVGNQGDRHCASSCAGADDCPKSYDCKEIEAGGQMRLQCVPASGSCICLGELDGKSEPCASENGFGKCFGEKVCDGPNGWTACSAATPAEEDCDGLDNDCDGEKDEGLAQGAACDWTNEHGTCIGVDVCIGAEGWQCSAKEPAAETCDSEDNDCDSATDEEVPEAGQACDSPDDSDKCAFGIFACEAGDLVCLGDTLQPESCNGLDDDCNGLTDELYDDTDGDGLADCVDPDDDDDEVLDEADNCPLVENDDQANADGDPLGDACDPDDDNDGVGDLTDCAPTDPTVKPGATEVCNGKDDNCDTLIDPAGSEGCNAFYIDADGDTFGFTPLMQCVCGNQGTPPYTAVSPGDCNDSNKAVNPLAAEVCNSLDDDCDDDVDNIGAAGCELRYRDHDEDDYGVHYDMACVCGGKGEYTAKEAGDCNDDNKNIFPGADEFCNGVDDNCNNTKDEIGSLGCNTYFLDQDGDGYGVTNFSKCLCAAQGDYKAEKKGDCDDSNKMINPGQNEVCKDGKDNDCDGTPDEPQCEG
jgi:hypothetical protein